MSRSPRSKGPPTAVSPQYAKITVGPTVLGPIFQPSSNEPLSPHTSRPAIFSAQQSNEPMSTAYLPSVAAITGEPQYRHHAAALQPSPKWRSTGIQSILNPASDLSKRHAPISTGLPEPLAGRATPMGTIPPFSSPRMRKRGESRSPSHVLPTHQEPARTDRRILTPKSPSLRATSLGQHQSPAWNRASMRPSEGRVYTADPGNRTDSMAVPPMPPLPAPKVTQPFNQPTPGSSDSTGRSAVGLKASQTLGLVVNTHPPAALTSSTSPSLQQSPSVLSQSQTPVPTSEFGPGFNPASNPGSRPGGPYMDRGWMLALEGGDVGVEVDNQQASKMADEKRKRNAGASARFRARRKEREKEASQTISGLQAELRGMADDRDFYVNERNFYRDFIARHHMGPLPPRPPSPQLRRVHGLVSTGHDSDISSDYGRRENTEVPEQRTRLNEFQPSYPAAASTAGPLLHNNVQYPGTYGPPSGPSYPYSHMPPSSLFKDARMEPAPATSVSLPRPQPRDAFPHDVLERKWNSGK